MEMCVRICLETYTFIIELIFEFFFKWNERCSMLCGVFFTQTYTIIDMIKTMILF